MADPKQDVCRNLAEQIWGAMAESEVGDNAVDTIEAAIRIYTIVPEIVRMLEVVEQKYPDTWTGLQIGKLLAKAEGKKP